jgi:Uma2 family endonuclease
MPEPVPREPTLQEIHDSLDIPGHRVELIGGRIVVSPSPVIRHGQIVMWLAESLIDVCAAKGWNRLPQTTLDLLATEERIVPDLLLYPDDESIAGEWLVPADRALLVAEVVSPSSRRDDYEDKRESCAQNGIPMYLIVDPFDATLTLCTEPSDTGYRLIHIVDAGGKLDLPEPFGITLDTSTIPINPKKK